MIGALGLPLCYWASTTRFSLAYHTICLCIAASFFVHRGPSFRFPIIRQANRAGGERCRAPIARALPLPTTGPIPCSQNRGRRAGVETQVRLRNFRITHSIGAISRSEIELFELSCSANFPVNYLSTSLLPSPSQSSPMTYGQLRRIIHRIAPHRRLHLLFSCSYQYGTRRFMQIHPRCSMSTSLCHPYAHDLRLTHLPPPKLFFCANVPRILADLFIRTSALDSRFTFDLRGWSDV